MGICLALVLITIGLPRWGKLSDDDGDTVTFGLFQVKFNHPIVGTNVQMRVIVSSLTKHRKSLVSRDIKLVN